MPKRSFVETSEGNNIVDNSTHFRVGFQHGTDHASGSNPLLRKLRQLPRVSCCAALARWRYLSTFREQERCIPAKAYPLAVRESSCPSPVHSKNRNYL